MRRTAVVLGSLIAIAGTSSADQGGGGVPDIVLSIAVRQKYDGKIDRGVHLLELRCAGGQCALTTLTLNQCMIGAFLPKIERTTTVSGLLKVTAGTNFLVARETGAQNGAYTTTLKFDFERERGGRAGFNVTGFSGAYVKNSAILGKVTATEYVPVQGPFEPVTMDCPALLPGVYLHEATE